MTRQNVIHDHAGSTGAIAGDESVRLSGMTSVQRLERIFALVGLRTGTFGRSVVIVNAGWVLDQSLIRALAGKLNTLLVADGGRSVALHVPAVRAAAAIEAFDAVRPPALTALTVVGSN